MKSLFKKYLTHGWREKSTSGNHPRSNNTKHALRQSKKSATRALEHDLKYLDDADNWVYFGLDESYEDYLLMKSA